MPITYEEPVRQDEFIPIESNAVGAAAQELTRRVTEDLVQMYESIYRRAKLRIIRTDGAFMHWRSSARIGTAMGLLLPVGDLLQMQFVFSTSSNH